MRKIRTLLCFFLVLCLLASLSAAFAATGTVSKNTGLRHQDCTALSAQAEAYYTGSYSWAALSMLKGVYAPEDSWAATQNNPLYSALQKLMTDTHTNKSISYNALPTYWKNTDAAGNSKSYLFFYGDVDSGSGTYTMNREHIWCKSNASFYELGGGADLHHLRPSISFVNAAKNYYVFGNVREKNYSDTTATSVNGTVVCWSSASNTLFEVKDDIKGDVARILLYVYVRWGQPNLYSKVASSKLPALDSDDTLNYGQKVVENLDVLLEWMENDPVDEWEMGRNDQVENVQGNRNVFIDYPELAWLMFGLDVPDDMTTPSGKASACPSEAYTDVPGEENWAHAGIDFVIRQGIMGSTKTDTLTFEPNVACSRGMIVSMLYRLAGSPAVTYENKFSDVPQGQWYTSAVIWAANAGVVTGYNTGKFGPNDLVTREQMAVILMKYTECVRSLPTGERANIADFNDETAVTWSRAAVRWAVAVGLISGKQSGEQRLLDPRGKATRAEVASILMRYIQNVLSD